MIRSAVASARQALGIGVPCVAVSSAPAAAIAFQIAVRQALRLPLPQ